MSTLKLKGSTSGYVELTAPATAGDNTITLPTTAGSVLVANSSGNVTVGTGVTILGNSGIVSATSYSGNGSSLIGVGKVRQVVQTVLGSTFTSTSQTFADTGMTASITPTSASSKILVTLSIDGIGERTGQFNIWLFVKLFRDSTQIGGQTNQMNWGTINNADMRIAAPGAYTFLDSPSTTSQITYKTQGALFPTGTVSVNAGSTITLMEIAA